METQRDPAQDTARPAAGHPVGRIRRARTERAEPGHGTARRQPQLSARLRRYLWYTAGALAFYLASLAYGQLDPASHAAVQSTNTPNPL